MGPDLYVMSLFIVFCSGPWSTIVSTAFLVGFFAVFVWSCCSFGTPFDVWSFM